MTMLRARAGFTLIEMMIFTGILALLSGTLVSTYIATQDARIRQQYIGIVEQEGVLLLSRLTSAVRASEMILSPASNQTGTILALQMRNNAEQPTIVIATSTGDLLLVQRDVAQSLLDRRLSISHFSLQAATNETVTISFDLSTVIRTHPPVPYSRHFQATTTRYPDAHAEAGGCGTCPAPVCSSGILTWHVCDEDVCAASGLSLACQ